MELNVTFLPMVTRPYKQWSDETLVLGSAKIAKAMNKNPNFPTLTKQVADYAVLQLAFAELYSDAEFRDVSVIAERNDARTELVDASIALGEAVQQIAGKNLAALISSGMPLKRAPQPFVLPLPSGFEITNGTNLGELIAKVKGIGQVSVYNFYYALDPLGDSPVWNRISSTTSKVVVGGFKPGTCVWFKVELVGPKGQRTWSAELLSPYVQNRSTPK